MLHIAHVQHKVLGPGLGEVIQQFRELDDAVFLGEFRHGECGDRDLADKVDRGDGVASSGRRKLAGRPHSGLHKRACRSRLTCCSLEDVPHDRGAPTQTIFGPSHYTNRPKLRLHGM